jgi:hypothetical protein
MAHRQLDVFFYGLFMDRPLLEGKGTHPTESSVSDPCAVRS